MKISDITADEHRLLKVKVDKKIPFWKIQKALKEAYGVDISRGRLSEAFSGIVPMPPQLERILEELLLENENNDNNGDEKEKDQPVKKESKQKETIIRVPPYSPHYSVYL